MKHFKPTHICSYLILFESRQNLLLVGQNIKFFYGERWLLMNFLNCVSYKMKPPKDQYKAQF